MPRADGVPRPGDEALNVVDDDRQAELRTRLRSWLAAHVPYPLPDSPRERFERLRVWQRMLFDAGWMGLAWPREYGGQGGEFVDQVVLNQELARSRAPSPPGIIGLQTVGPTILTFGTEGQRRRFLAPILDASEIWCQGFSEPGAGSDLASLRTSAVRDGDDLVVNGQKVWTSWAQYADWCAVLVRTDHDLPKHRGLSYLLVDMATPGITVRPIRQITGDDEFNEVFFDDVAVPCENLLGGLHDGWRVAMSTLSYEQAMYILSRSVELRVALDELEEQMAGATLDAAAAVGECEVLLRVLEAQGFSTLTRLQRGGAGDVSAVEKLLMSEIEQAVFDCALDQCGPFRAGVLGAEGPAVDAPRWVHDYLQGRSATIHGGTAEILRMTIAQRMLGLPRS